MRELCGKAPVMLAKTSVACITTMCYTLLVAVARGCRLSQDIAKPQPHSVPPAANGKLCLAFSV